MERYRAAMSKAEPSLDLQSAADEIGVHYQTAYRWVRNGKLAASTVDGKYRIERSALDSLIRTRSTPRRPAAPNHKRLDTAAVAMYDALVDGDEPAATELARRLVAEGSSLAVFIQRVLVPAVARVGAEWHDGRLSIWQEHRASAITDRLLGEIARNPRGRRRGTVMVAAVEGDRHSLPTTMAAMALRDANWRVHHLGADIPDQEILDFCSSQHVDVAVLTVTDADRAAHATSLGRRIEASGVPVLVGGPGRSLHELLDLVDAVTGHVN